MRTISAADKAQAGTPLTEMWAEEFLPEEERGQVVDAFTTLLESLYAHLPLKRAMYGIDPVQQLRRLKQRLGSIEPGGFQRELSDIIRSLRDAHTVYVGPRSMAGHVARLPFLVEQYGDPGMPRYLVSKVAPDMVEDDEFTEGVDLETWNGSPIGAAINARARQEIGGRVDSGRARAVESLTFRSLRYEPAPDERWVVVGYRDQSGEGREVRIPWDVIKPGEGPEAIYHTSSAALASAINPAAADVRRAKKLMFNRDLWRREDTVSSATVSVDSKGTITGRFQDNVSGHIRETSAGTFGHLRIWGFDLADDEGFIDEVIQILELLPQEGLVVDVRANPGGLIWAAERLLQLFTPGAVEPCRFSFLATEATESLAAARQNQSSLGPWLASLTSARGTGELYSQALPITPPELCNNIGQVYGGPVVAVVDATTYSAGDLFAAGFVDNGIGTLVTVGDATGAGGANVWSAETVAALTADSPIQFTSLPAGAGFTVSIRRATRVGSSAGLPIEDIGVAGHRQYSLTKDDLLHGNKDLLDYCGRLLASTPRTAMNIALEDESLTVTTEALTIVDIFADGHPIAPSMNVAGGGEISVAVPAFRDVLEVRGFKGDVLKQRRLIRA